MTEQKKRGGLFDLRYILALLFIIYGVVTLILGIVDYTPAAQAKTGGFNINLWGGLVLILAALFFFGWAWLRPVVIESTVAAEEMERANLEPGAETTAAER